jgi:putative toxin-antitoxin system antitoxin component (TIGR02293 family)
MAATQKPPSAAMSRVVAPRRAVTGQTLYKKSARAPKPNDYGILSIRIGVPAADWKKTAAALGLPSERLISLLDVKRSTIKRDEQNGTRLSTTNSDKLYRVRQIHGKAMRVFEDEASAKAWLQMPQRSLGGDVPLSLLDTTLGYELVGDALERIEAGIVA